MSTDDPNSQVTDWDPNPVYELGNAWIAFGDLLDEQVTAMAVAQFDLKNGAWMGDASISMAAAFGTMRDNQVWDVVVQCWKMGESINYYAMLRSQQQATEAKQTLRSEERRVGKEC